MAWHGKSLKGGRRSQDVSQDGQDLESHANAGRDAWHVLHVTTANLMRASAKHLTRTARTSVGATELNHARHVRDTASTANCEVLLGAPNTHLGDATFHEHVLPKRVRPWLPSRRAGSGSSTARRPEPREHA